MDANYEHGDYMLNVLGIVKRDDGKILIMKREDDSYIKELSWCFPGGRPERNEELEDALKRSVKEKTNIDIENIELIFARAFEEKREFLLLYFECDAVNEDAKPLKQCTDVKWVNPTEVKEHFTTSIHPKVYNFLRKLEKV